MSLAEWCKENNREDLLLDWDYEKNGSLIPEIMAKCSKKKVWWKCHMCGFEWEYDTEHQTAKKTVGCPMCKKKKLADLQRIPQKGVNDLATTHPELLKEWDYEKNTEFTPDNIKAGSNYKVWWKCINGHSWEAAPAVRSKGIGCPECAKEIHSSFPEQALYYYAKKYFPDTINSDHKAIGKELDIYIPSEHIAMEYDGVQWHNSEASYKKEERKDMACLKKGIRMIRIREKNLRSHPNSICITRESTGSYSSLSEAIFCALKLVKDTVVYDIDVKRDIMDIYNMITYKRKANSLQEAYPEIANEWDHSRNGKLTPIQVTSGSNKLVYWKCSKGHSWQALVGTRVRGNGCPYCSNHSVLTGYNDLVTIAPDIAAEWDYEKNGDVKPEVVLAGSADKYWWRCKDGHPSWQATVDARRQGDGCPYCSGRLAIVGVNDLATTNPKMASEWDYEKNTISPLEVKGYSGKKYWWKCSKGHSWLASPNNRNKAEGCPYCSGHRAIKGETDLATTNPQLIKEWDFEKNTAITPYELTPGSSNKVWWKCLKGHSWETSVNSRIRGRGCPYCINKKVLRGYNDLATTDPKLLEEWDFDKNTEISPYEVTSGTEKKAWWKCKNGHEWQVRIANRKRGDGCPYCSNKKVFNGDNALLTINPELAKEWDSEKHKDLSASEVSSNSGQKVWWKCSKGHSWEATIASRSSGNGCPYCVNQKVLAGYNDLATTGPQIAMEWDYEKNSPLTPNDITSKSGKKVWWKCKNGHSWDAIIKSRTSGTGCPICSNKRIEPGINDLATLYPDVVKEWDFDKNEISPNTVSVGSDKKVWWKCHVCGFGWQARIINRVKGHGCPVCCREGIVKANGKRVRCVETGIIYDSTTRACKNAGVTAGAIGACARGETRTAGGYHWEYIEKEV